MSGVDLDVKSTCNHVNIGLKPDEGEGRIRNPEFQLHQSGGLLEKRFSTMALRATLCKVRAYFDFLMNGLDPLTLCCCDVNSFPNVRMLHGSDPSRLCHKSPTTCSALQPRI